MSAAGDLPASFFTSPEITEREVELADGSKHMLAFREASSKVWRRYWFAAGTAREDGDSDEFDRAVADLIAASLVNLDGTPVMDAEKARTLKFEVQSAIVKALRTASRGDPGKA
jgi:hypothetical protein